ncbi:SET domain-containing protein 4 [Lampris incognitus]|uniref:SET domain-containing protein 4 n=1 Tax=Lampris incognitus TaxID=2546036 RepID=UPI0024B62064|nr:SET domain-containing protein 4 [Lampris incognitus]XP_056147563.1 SET domain-containing protein 4 [Lampris incognitus]
MIGCGCRAGRAMRKRRRKRGSTDQSISLSHQPQYVSLMKFLHHRGFTSTLLQPNHFTDTGRGLQARQTIKPGELLISLPEPCLITTSTVLNSYLGQYIKSWKSRLSPLLVLCVFMVCERHQGEDSDWFPYVNVLPSFYTCPTYFSDDVIAVLPSIVRKRALEQRKEVSEIHSANQDFFRSLQPILRQPVEEVFTYEALRWAFFSVNTRSVFLSRPASPFLSGEDVYVLAPFLDLLNHRPDVKVAASFNPVTKCYEIRTAAGIQCYQQAFINYGSHDNQRLLLEYGFVAPGNPHSVVYVETDQLCNVLRGDRSLDQKMKFLKENNFSHNLTVSSDGPSWRLMTVLRLFALPQTMYPHWKAVLLGQAVSAEREQWSIQIAQTLCQQLLQGTHAALNKISQLFQQCDQPIREQLDAVNSLRQEERGILESCLVVLQGILRQPSSSQPDPGLLHQPDSSAED